MQRLTQSLSSFHSTCPDLLTLLFLIIKLTGSNPKSSLSSSLFFQYYRAFSADAPRARNGLPVELETFTFHNTVQV